ncbi:phage baseplate protein [Streptomyces antarcticus]|uniref:phage baseplate protein n=1 Tax=Streptomyces antarcticus TaxID=2996458 RepID=UPI00226DEAEA|nr:MULTISPECIES: hypothetical protein [unclassified Streptomyces]MCY0942609.1 hypothetical protein [Streptomyces sp. H34-AA3]MCZ4081355.1 hypothetical protein [Streptomyces sp. H34-S5]
MALPESIPTVLVHGRYLAPDGTPLTGQVIWRAPALLTFADSDVFLSGPVTAPLDATGRFQIALPATDAPGMNPSGWAYTVSEQLIGVPLNRSYNVLLPMATPEVDLADVVAADPTTPNYVPVPGPPGLVTSVNGKSAASITLTSSDVGAAPAVPGDSARVSFSGTSRDLFAQVLLQSPTVAQEFAFDYVNQCIYVPQIIGGGQTLPGESAPKTYAERDAAGDIAVNKLSYTGALLGTMFVRGAGHGSTCGVEYGRDGTVWLWLCRDASGSGFARSLSRLPFLNGAVIESRATSSYSPLAGLHGVSASVDTVNRRIAIRYTYPDPGNGRRYQVFNLDDAVSQNWARPLATFAQDANEEPSTPEGPAVGTFQGQQLYGSYVYTLDGYGDSADNTYLTTIDWTTGRQVERTKITTHAGYTYREPEGLGIHIPDTSAPHRFQLCYGFANGATGARNFTIAGIEAATVNPVRLGVNLPLGQNPAANAEIIATSGIPGLAVKGSGGANITEWTNNGASTPATWISSTGHVATIKNIYATGDAIQVGSLTTDVGGGKGVIGVTNTATPPTAHPSAGAVIYATGGAARIRGNGLAVVDSAGLETELTASPLPSPADHGFLAWSLDPAGANSQTAPASGVMQLVRLRLRSPRTVSSVVLHLNNAGAGLVAGQNAVGLYNMAGTRLAQSADQSTAWATAGEKTIPFTAPLTALAAGNYWIGILSNGTTPPTITRASGQGGNMGIPLPETRFGVVGAGLAALPASITPASVTQAAVAYIVGIR